MSLPQSSLDLSQSSLDHLPKDPLKKGSLVTKKRKLNKQEKVEKAIQIMVDAFVVSKEKARKVFLELEKKMMEMEKEQAKNEERREDRFLCIMHDTILMMHHPAPVLQLLPQPEEDNGMYHFDMPDYY